MGIPKFFRWMSERYPMCSQLVTENHIPEFDNFYLDMNGIIHNCSHANESSAHFRVKEEQIWLAIFTYIDHMFMKIKPKKIFFMAIDGVAPRAKMNQQRARRFRSAKDADDNRKKAIAKGEALPDEDPFDSNCITPGTEFMAKLTSHLKYFINKKITEDAAWRVPQIILSGHEVPGEGEHKIMEYIRLCKAQPDYDPNTRHCLYGLDADLIMLGLLSHDPHFALLREEVTFGRGGQKKKNSIQNQTFYLMHLSLVREYLDLEFESLKLNTTPKADLETTEHEGDDAVLNENETFFEYDLECIIDDFILISLFIGNDFLPHLPGLHIAEGALGLMFNIYKRVVIKAGGYINEGGILNLARLEILLNELKEKFEYDIFVEEATDLKWLRGKQMGDMQLLDSFIESSEDAETTETPELEELEEGFLRVEVKTNGDSRRKKGKNFGKGKEKTPKLVMTTHQKELYDLVKEFVLKLPNASNDVPNVLHFSPNERAKDRAFIQRLAKDLSIRCGNEYSDDGNTKHIYLEPFDRHEENDSSEDEEAIAARNRVLRRYDNAKVEEEIDETEEERDLREKQMWDQKFLNWRRDYYWDKMQLRLDEPNEMDPLLRSYVEGLQWVLHYYYSGVADWSWFYPFHYAPKIADLSNIERYRKEFSIGMPFKPFEQLLGVLPSLSDKLIPLAYRDLMTDPSSPIIDFYPTDFELDMNGKKQDWEAIVKVPFIDQDRLLAAMKAREHRLTEIERQRNASGECLVFQYDADIDEVYESSLPGIFPDIPHCTAKTIVFYLPTLHAGLSFRNKLLDGAQLGAKAMAGFPSLMTIPHTASLEFHGVNVFQSESKNESIVITIKNIYEDKKVEDIAKTVIGKRVFIGWPFLREAFVTSVSDEFFKYSLEVDNRDRKRIIPTPHDPDQANYWRQHAERLQYQQDKRFATLIGQVSVVLHVLQLQGMRRNPTGELVKEYVPITQEQTVPIQVTVEAVMHEDERFLEKPALPLGEEYPNGTQIFFLGAVCYGAPAEVVDHSDKFLTIKTIIPKDGNLVEPTFGKDIVADYERSCKYYPSYQVSKMLDISSYSLSRITSSVLVVIKGDEKINLGLNLKFESRRQKVLGYSRKLDSTWEYSDKTVALLNEYKEKFPEFINGLGKSSKKVKMDFCKPEDFYPQEQAKEKILEIRDWLKEKGVKEFELVSLESEYLDKDVILEIEKAADNAVKNQQNIKEAIIKNVPRQGVLKPSHGPFRLQDQEFQLGDRVIVIHDEGTAPIGAKGTVISIDGKSFDILFDTSFMGGTSLGGRCSPHRGLTVRGNQLLNLSNPQFAHYPASSARPVYRKSHPSSPIPPSTPASAASQYNGLQPSSVLQSPQLTQSARSLSPQHSINQVASRELLAVLQRPGSLTDTSSVPALQSSANTSFNNNITPIQRGISTQHQTHTGQPHTPWNQQNIKYSSKPIQNFRPPEPDGFSGGRGKFDGDRGVLNTVRGSHGVHRGRGERGWRGGRGKNLFE